MALTPAAAAWLFGEEEVIGPGRFNTKLPSGAEVDALALASVVVIRAAWGLRERGLITLHAEAVEPVKRKRFLGLRIQVGDDAPTVRVQPVRDQLEPTVEGLLLGLLHGRRPKPGQFVRAAMNVPDPWSVFDRFAPATDLTSLGAVVSASFSADAWLKACHDEVRSAGADRTTAEGSYRESLERWEVFRRAERPLLDACNRVVGDAIRFTSISTR